MRTLASVVLGIAAWLCAGPAWSGAVPIVVERFDPPGAEPAAADVLAGRLDAGFSAEPYAAVTPDPDHAVWYRLRLAADWRGPRPPVLSIADPAGLFVTAYLPPGHEAAPLDIYEPAAQNGFSRHALVQVLPVELAAAAPIYLRVGPGRAAPHAIAVRDILEARVDDLARARLDIAVPAVQLAAVLVMLCFFFALRERMYVYFVGHVVFIVLYELYAFGIGYELFPLRLLAPLGQRPVWLAAALSSAMMVAFARQFLELARCAARLDRAFRVLVWPFLALAACAAIPPLSSGWWVQDALSLLLFAYVPLLIVSAVLAWQSGGRRGGFFLCAWVPGLLFVMLRVLQLILYWPLPPWLEFVLPATFAYAELVLAYGLADQTLSIRHERDVARRLAEHDALTGVLNRRAILAQLRATFLQARESGEPLSVLFLDIDHFKQINDRYGHRAGDQCLRAIIGPIVSELRQGDSLGRYGGEEFLVVLPGAAVANARAVAERIRERVQQLPLLVSGTRVGLTLSVGVAEIDHGVQTPDELIERADAALYRSKSAGRNVVSLHGTLLGDDDDRLSGSRG